MGLIHIEDFSKSGWQDPQQAGDRARQCCECLEQGDILFFNHSPFPLSRDDESFLRDVRQTASAVHKNIAYKPDRDRVQGFARQSADGETLRRILRSYSRSVADFLQRFLTPYAGHWRMDFASFRSIEEEGRGLPIEKRNDLLHVDSFPTRPANGHRILRVFTNLNPERSRVWLTSDPFDLLVRKYADPGRLRGITEKARSPLHAVSRKLLRTASGIGIPVVDRPLYDEFMLGFHHDLKHNRDFQENCPKSRWEFPPGSAWLVFTDMVPHAVLSGQYALEQTFIIQRDALLLAEKAPYRVLQELTGVPVVD